MDLRLCKKAFVLMLTFVLTFLLAACQEQIKEEPTVLDELSKLEGKEGNWLGLTTEQKLEDFDFLYQTLQENYPYFHILKRMHDVDLEQAYQETRAEVAKSGSDAAFFAQVEIFTRNAQMVGHLSTITPMDYDWFLEAYQNQEGVPEEELPRMEKLYQAYGNETSRASYAALGDIFWSVMEQVQSFYDEQEDDSTAVDEPQAYQEVSNVGTRIIEENQIAYIAINSFDMSYYSEDRETLFNFYRKVQNYPHVIIDISDNGGGGMSYFDDLVVAPNIAQTLSCDVYELAKLGANNQTIMDFSDYKPISELPDLPKLNKEDLADLDVFDAMTYSVTPLSDTKMLQGKLWLLVGPRVFSSSEYAAMFTKATGFATLVGQTTGGDGIGEDPVPIVLPNSGLIVRYSPIYGVTFDGTGSQEFGTEPDIFSNDGESALDACLRTIKQE